jgi:alkanesulfonate monooxygenase SsuD/methylene tetrahydromethanopterin reductase-like flavin-dependent oxidoreductase (luciferase family)
MGKLEFAIWDGFQAHDMTAADSAADVYKMHIEEAQLAEKLGYESYYVIEHQNSYVSHLTAPNVYLTAVARNTTDLRLGVMIYQLPFHHPIRLAQECAMLDQLSRGRLEFGVGAGVHEHEFMRYNLDFFQRREMFSEAFDIIIKAWTQDEVTHHGKYWQMDEVFTNPKPYQQPHPPVWIAAHSEPSFEFAAKHNYDVSQNIDVDEVVAEKFDFWRRNWKEYNHPGPMPRTFLMRAVHVAETDEKARAEIEPALMNSRNLGPEFIANTRLGFRGNDDSPANQELARVFREQSKSYDFWIEHGLALVGSPDTVIKQIEKQKELTGYDILCCNHRPGVLSTELANKSMRMFGEEVMPAFR